MKYRVCPKCELNYITEDEELCSVCLPKITSIKVKKQTEKDFTKIEMGKVYGGNSRKIYETFCDTLNWDKSKVNQFGWQTPLYAKNADTNRENDVWFIFYPNYDRNKLDAVVNNYHVVNLITENDNKIIEVVDEHIGSSNNANRITFVKTNNGYEFLGVYKIVKNGTTRVYERIFNKYPF